MSPRAAWALLLGVSEAFLIWAVEMPHARWWAFPVQGLTFGLGIGIMAWDRR